MENDIRGHSLKKKIVKAFETIWEVDDSEKISMIFFSPHRRGSKEENGHVHRQCDNVSPILG